MPEREKVTAKNNVANTHTHTHTHTYMIQGTDILSKGI